MLQSPSLLANGSKLESLLAHLRKAFILCAAPILLATHSPCANGAIIHQEIDQRVFFSSPKQINTGDPQLGSFTVDNYTIQWNYNNSAFYLKNDYTLVYHQDATPIGLELDYSGFDQMGYI